MSTVLKKSAPDGMITGPGLAMRFGRKVTHPPAGVFENPVGRRVGLVLLEANADATEGAERQRIEVHGSGIVVIVEDIFDAAEHFEVVVHAPVRVNATEDVVPHID